MIKDANMTQDVALKLHDIKGLVAVPDDSLYYFVALLIGLILLLIAAAYLLYRYVKREKSVNLQKFYLEKLHALDLSKSKESAYALTEYGRLLEKDQPQKVAYEAMLEKLEAYKYQKAVAGFDKETVQSIEIFLGRL